MFEVGSKNPEEALDDNLLSTNIRRKIEKFLYKNHVRVENDLIPLNRADIENYLLKKYCRDTTSFDDFVEIYNKFIFENHLQENKNLLYTDDVMRTRLNRLAESDLVLWKTFKRMRYYNIEAQDYTELLETLNLEQYENIHLSTMKFMMEFPDIMKHYDIRDEYELHNLLKKIKADQNIKSMEFGRMPTLKFGDFDINTFVKEKLFELSPISTDDLTDEISNELGYLVDTIKANWFNNIKEYYHNGVYETDVISLPDSHFEILVNNLEADFHYIKDIKKLYENLIENADISLISSYNLKKMGFICNSGYVIKNYSSAEAYFRSILLKEDVFDITQINNKYRYLTTYSALLTKVRNSFDIIEFEPNQYINIRRLNELNIYPKDLIEFSNQVYEYVENEEFFTMEMIRNRGFNSKLDFLGFNELFYKSLIKSDERFTYQNVGGNTVFSRNNDQFVTIDLIVNILIEEISIHVEDMIHLLAQDYNIILKREKIITMVNESELYYDRITEKIYLNYSVYFEEI